MGGSRHGYFTGSLWQRARCRRDDFWYEPRTRGRFAGQRFGRCDVIFEFREIQWLRDWFIRAPLDQDVGEDENQNTRDGYISYTSLLCAAHVRQR
jgi:hypothetical protein